MPARDHVALIRVMLAAAGAELERLEAFLPGGPDYGLWPGAPEWLTEECPECGILWRLPSPDCPRKKYNRHPVGRS